MPRHRNKSPVPDSEAPVYDGPSKSARKRAAQDAQALGTELVNLTETRLRELPLEESLLEAILAARAIKAHGGRARQLQFIGKLMRNIDVTPILAALEEPARLRALETERDKRISRWRDRLLTEGAVALQELRSSLPNANLDLLAQTLGRARDPRLPEALQLGAKRELFRALRALMQG